MSSVARAVSWASCCTSAATTAKPLPASPARAASMVAFRASRLVWSAMLEMILMTSPMAAEADPRLSTSPVIVLARSTASSATRSASVVASRNCSTDSSRPLAPAFSAPVRRRVSIRCETNCCTLRSAPIRDSDRVIRSVVKKSIVPATWPLMMIGKQIPDFTPARPAAGARTQSVSSARSCTKTRSRARQARPESPTPSAKLAARVTLRNSSPAEPDSWSNRSTFSSSTFRLMGRCVTSSPSARPASGTEK